MILTRVWYLLLVIAAVVGAALAMVSVRVIDKREAEAVTDALRRDRLVLEQTLKLDARARIDAIAPLAAAGDVRSALREASARRSDSVDTTISQRLGPRLAELNRQLEGLAGDILFAVDTNGTIIAQVGGSAPPAGAGLAGFPLVRRALDGYLRDDVWIYNDDVYRMAARPVIDNGQYVGAVIHGKRIDSAFAERLGSRSVAGASVGFFRGDRVLGSSMGQLGVRSAPRQEDLAAPLAQVIADARFASGETSEPIELPTGGLGIYSRIVGSAGDSGVGYVVARGVPVLGSPTAIFALPSAEDWSGLPWVALVLGGLFAFGLAMLFVWLERDRPERAFEQATARLGKREIEKLLPTEFGGALRAAAAHINDALDKLQDGSPKRRAQNLDEILGPSPVEPAPAFFGFAGGNQTQAADDFPPVPPADAPKPIKAGGGTQSSPGSAAGAPFGPPRAPSTGSYSPAPAPSAPLAGGGVANVPAVPKPPTVPAPLKPTPAAVKPATPVRPTGGTLLGLPGDPAVPGLGPIQAQARSVSHPSIDEDEDDGATMVARVPEELLAKSALLAGGNPEAEQEAHYREVFDQFVAMKKQCGEPTAGLTFEKFAVTLRKNREQIVQKHDVQKVRFTVYSKDGKAALKATPIRD